VQDVYVRHIITPRREGAFRTVDMMMIGLVGDANKIEIDGYYADVYVKTARGWRFKQRTHHAELDAGRRVTPPPASRAP